jgi:hypothetical protein
LLIDIGIDALPSLQPILDDDRPARLFGSQIAVHASIYNYRRKDYAYRYISRILGREPVFKDSPAERDKDIASLKKSLNRGEEKER